VKTSGTETIKTTPASGTRLVSDRRHNPTRNAEDHDRSETCRKGRRSLRHHAGGLSRHQYLQVCLLCMCNTFCNSLPEVTAQTGGFKVRPKTHVSCCMSKPSGPKSTPGAIPGYTGRRRSRPKCSQCTVCYVSGCKRILTQFTHPSIRATEAGFLQSERYQLTYD